MACLHPKKRIDKHNRTEEVNWIPALILRYYAFEKKHVTENSLLLLLVTRPLPRDGGMAEDHGAPESGQLPRFWTRGRTETESRQRVSGAKSP